ncbi:MAG: TniQ family protein [Sulfuricella sp.]
MNPFMDLENALDHQPPPNVPPRSALFSLSPTGVGTQHQESLLSLLVRTSQAHAVSPRRLISEVFGAVDPSISKLSYAGFFSSLAGTVNGLGHYAELFVSATERLTGLQDLRHLTLLPWQDLFPHNGQGLLSRHPKWCPACLYQQRLLEQATVFPLMWYIEANQACSEHLCALEDRCPHCGKAQPYLPRFPDIGICDHCRHPLAGPRPQEVVPQFKLWVAEAVGGMVMRQTEPGFTPSIGRFRDFVRERVQALTAGNRAAFCRAVGFNDRGLNGWLNKRERPAVTQFLALCYGVKVMPKDVFEGASPSTVGTELRSPPTKLKGRGLCPRPSPERRKEWEEFLHIRLNSEESMPVTAIAANLGVGSSCLRYWFSDLCAALSERHRVAAKARSEIHRAQQSRRVEEIVKMIRVDGRYPSHRQVNTVLRQEGMSLAQPHLLQAYLKVLGDL